MNIASSLAVAVGLSLFSLAIYGQIANVAYDSALGVFFIVIGLLGFTSLRITKLEDEISELEKMK